MWYSAPVEYGNIFNIEVYDQFLVAILYPAMYYKEDIVIHGAVSKKLFKNIIHYVKNLLLTFSNELTDINIKIEGYANVTKKNSLVGTGFSGGVDSFATFVENYANEDDTDYKINNLFFFNVGSHGRFSNPYSKERFMNRYESCREFPNILKLPFIPIDSNVHAFHEEWGHECTDTITLVSGILSIQSILSKYYVSSGVSYSEMLKYNKLYKNFDIAAFADPYLIPLLCSDGLEIIPNGVQYLRSEKIILISDYEYAHKYLNVCVNHIDGYTVAKNCSACSKCLRTLMALDSCDKLNDFSQVFDIGVYKKNAFKYKCLQRLLYNKDPFAKDNVDFARKHGKTIPPLFLAFFVCLPYVIKNIVVKTLRCILGNREYKQLKVRFFHFIGKI